MKTRFTSQALQDLDEIKTWLRLKNPRGYNSIANQIAKTIRPVALHPDLGRKTLRDDIRELVEPRYGFIIPYTTRGDTVFILRVYNGKRYPLDFSGSPESNDPT